MQPQWEVLEIKKAMENTHDISSLAHYFTCMQQTRRYSFQIQKYHIDKRYLCKYWSSLYITHWHLDATLFVLMHSGYQRLKSGKARKWTQHNYMKINTNNI